LSEKIVHVVGGGLAGSEAAYQIAQAGYDVVLHEMRPVVKTDVHETGKFAELVCSNSLKSVDLKNASGLLKKELNDLDSFVLKIANKHAIEGGKALVVDRETFSEEITSIIESHPKIHVQREEITEIPPDDFWIMATGPATSEKLYKWIMTKFKTGSHFFDAVAPIIDATTIDMSKTFLANRYEDKGKDYFNCPMNKDEYLEFRENLVNAEVLPMEKFDRKLLFSRCQPIEEIARSGIDAMRYGPLRPVGLELNGKRPYAVVQLRRDNYAGTLLNIVGFQTRLKWHEQQRVFRMIPGLENVKIVRYGVMHANIYIEPFKVTDEFFRSKDMENLFFAGQITGVEGYVESIATGLYVGRNVVRILNGLDPERFSCNTMIGALIDYVTKTKDLQPMYANFGILGKGKR
jgi:methylenetetrahydrofolate--tRNA-(uracil-5-)-methyltransferase